MKGISYSVLYNLAKVIKFLEFFDEIYEGFSELLEVSESNSLSSSISE